MNSKSFESRADKAAAKRKAAGPTQSVGRPSRPWSRRKRERHEPNRGCGYFLFVCVAACTLLLLNGAIIGSLFAWYQPLESVFGDEIRVKQAVTLVLPVALVLVEYWVFDFISDRLSTFRDEFDEGLTNSP